ncbi:OadG family protein [Oscillibacter sp. MSJ-2]|uniref:OadG family protein n=1 Tax=Dysosmobacter acutus TaxID=2841504 RepID=A0ABS6FDV2_9FIRM|nr:OadG family protein [Dysosmobacter acutus]MBU5627504.1 OadG family protein [Dysosmobacter acutus]
MQVSNLFVCVMGMGVTFIGLICLIFLIQLQSLLFGKKEEPAAAVAATVPASVPPTPAQEAIPNRGELIAAISAVVAEDMGVDVSAIRILSLKKIS